MYKFIDNLIEEVSDSKAIIEVSAFSLLSDVNHKALSETLSIVVYKLDNVLIGLEKLIDYDELIDPIRENYIE